VAGPAAAGVDISPVEGVSVTGCGCGTLAARSGAAL
jgi:hypothetical protein